MKLQRLGHVMIAVRDLEASKRFYMDLLGFALLEQDVEHGGAFLALGTYGNTLDLFQTTEADVTPPSASEGMGPIRGLGVKHVAFAVDRPEDLQQAHRELRAAGIVIEHAVDHVSQQSIYFSDPDGNTVEIVWERPDALEIFARGREDNDAEIRFE